jgi:hypothetical protein
VTSGGARPAGRGRGCRWLDVRGGVGRASVLWPAARGPSGAGAGRGGSVSLMSAAQFRRSVTIPAVPEQVREARAFVARVLGESHVHADLALLLSTPRRQRVHQPQPPAALRLAGSGRGGRHDRNRPRSGRVTSTRTTSSRPPRSPSPRRRRQPSRYAARCWSPARWATSGAAGSRRRGSSSGRAEPD